MRRWTTIALGVLAAAAVTLAACGGNDPEPSKRGKAKPDAAEIYRPEIPEKYKDVKPPEGMDLTDPKVIEAGKKHFLSDPPGPDCKNCHGPAGKGDGPMGKTLTDPKPRDLTDPTFHGAVSDQYIFFRIKEGGTGYKNTTNPSAMYTAMTGFPTAEDDAQIWEVVAYVRSLKGK